MKLTDRCNQSRAWVNISHASSRHVCGSPQTSFSPRKINPCCRASGPGAENNTSQPSSNSFTDRVRGLLTTLLRRTSLLAIDESTQGLESWGPIVRTPGRHSASASPTAVAASQVFYPILANVEGGSKPTWFSVEEMLGRDGLGVFATQDIPAGTRILVDPLLFSIPVAFDDESEQRMQAAIRATVAALPTTQQEEYLVLANSEPETTLSSSSGSSSSSSSSDGSNTPTRIIDSNSTSTNDSNNSTINISSGTVNSSSSSSSSSDGLNCSSGSSGSSAAVGVFRTNSYAIQRNGVDEAGIFVSTSRFNHSCNCNIEHSFNNSLQAMTLHASRDILCGEELCTSYLEMAQSREDRQDELLKFFNFQCCCQACVLTGSDLTASDSRRLEIVSSEVVFQSALALKQYGEGVRLVQRRVSLIQDEGLSGLVLLGECYYDAYEACRRAGKQDESRQWLQLAYDSAVTAQGEDGAGALMFGKLLNGQTLIKI